MRTIAQALKDEIDYPVSDGKIKNRLMRRGLEGGCEISAEVLDSPEFNGAVADCLYSLVEAPDFSESDISISLPDRDLILKKANAIYLSIGEEEKKIDRPKVYVGWPQYHK